MVVLCRYAYIEIALYGKSYIQSAKDTWRLFQDRGRGLPTFLVSFDTILTGIDALVNDSLVGTSMES